MWQLSESIDGMAEALPRPRPARHRRQRLALQRERRQRHRPHAGHRAARRAGPSRGAAAGLELARRRHRCAGRRASRSRRSRLSLSGGLAGPRAVDGAAARSSESSRRRSRRRSPSSPREVARICAGEASDVTAVHDVGGGGLATALAEMAAVDGARRDASTSSKVTASSSLSFPDASSWPPVTRRPSSRRAARRRRAGRGARARSAGRDCTIGSSIDLSRGGDRGAARSAPSTTRSTSS